tara:strand:+ start:217 stop:375 length:159 start_codon:yes stop_codon:yes gene_type:complete
MEMTLYGVWGQEYGINCLRILKKQRISTLSKFLSKLGQDQHVAVIIASDLFL